MHQPEPSPPSRGAGPILLSLSAGQEASRASEALTQAGLPCTACSDIEDLCCRVGDATGVVVLAEEGLTPPAVRRLIDTLAAQPAWSDLPLIVFVSSGVQPFTHPGVQALHAAAQVTLQSRPLQAEVFVSVIRAALRARQRQYEVRDLPAAPGKAGPSARAGRQAMEPRRLHEEYFPKALLRAVSDVVFRLDPDGVFLDFIPTANFDFLVDPPDFLGRPVREVLPPEIAEPTMHHLAQALETGRLKRFEYDLPVNGSRRHFEARIVPDGTGTVLAAVRDITRRRHAEEALQQSEARFRMFFEMVAIGAAQADAATGRFLQVNRRFCEITGYDREELLTLTVPEIIHHEDQTRVRETLKRLTQGGIDEYRAERRYRRKDGRVIWCRATVSLVRDASKRPLYTVAAIEDITERKRAEAALRHSEEQLKALNETLEQRVVERTAALARRTEQVRSLASALTLAEQQERRRISQVLHDHLQQMLYGIQLHVQALRLDVPAEHAQRLAQIDGLILKTIEVTRTLTVELSPPVLDGEGLAVALQWLALHMERLHGLKVDLVTDGSYGPLNEDMRVLLFQLVRELLFNVVKHAGVDRARVTLHEQDARFSVSVEDGGAGFDPAAVLKTPDGRRGGVGLFSMRERLALFDGQLDVESLPERGTRITISVPLTPRVRPRPA